MNLSTFKILVLDDESFMLKLLVHLLGGLGYTDITACDNGAAGLDWVGLPDNRHGLILLDLNMPDMDGIEFVRKLAGNGFSGSVILVSGEDERVLQMTEKLIQAHGMTVLGHVAKPVALSRLATLIELHGVAPQIAAQQDAQKNMYSADSIRAAIDNGEMVNYYQPQVSITTGKVVGVETLVRWRHPVDGLVFPDQFVGVAERNGLIDALTQIVMRSAFAQMKLWWNDGLELCVAVNVSMDNLSSLEFADFVIGEAQQAGIAPQNVVLEVTESRLMLDQRAPLEVLTRLRLKRFRLSIDDFGTGHSSLTQLSDISFDELKIDHSFVHGASHDKTARAIYDASLGVGKQLGMTVVAEGVEDSDDWDLLKRTNCDVAQGYLIGRPMPAAAMEQWIACWPQRFAEL
jgi:EAL domain-containing protein (putative c-di-GMP-specific phosphodiesterase class I)/FixJ family two-component response regulator